jgi:addiction module RelB/DinJ family antitoxin
MKDSVVTARIDSKLKKEAESILKKLGLNTSTAIGLFYSNVVVNKGLPFRLRLDFVPPVSEEEQKDIEKILKKRTAKDRQIVHTESYQIKL